MGGLTSGKSVSATLAAGENHLGSVGGDSGFGEETFVCEAGAIETGEVLTNTLEITDILRLAGGTGIIHSFKLNDKDDNGIALDVVFLRTNVSLGTKAVAVSITDSNADEILGIISVATGDWVDLVNNQTAFKSNLGIGSKGDSLDDLFVSIIARGSATFTASGITIQVFTIQD